MSLKIVMVEDSGIASIESAEPVKRLHLEIAAERWTNHLRNPAKHLFCFDRYRKPAKRVYLQADAST